MRLDKIEKEIQAGLKAKAAQRLRSLISEYPNNMDIRERLAELYYESGFLDAAGKYWILTEPKEERVKKSIELYEQTVNNSGTQILNELTFRGDKKQLPVYAQNKLAALEKDSKSKSNYIPEFNPKSKRTEKNEVTLGESVKENIIRIVFFIVIVSIPILTIVGFITVLKWIF